MGTWALCLGLAFLAAGCRLDHRDARTQAREEALISGGWKTFSEVYHPGEGYEIHFLSLGMVAREGGRISESWAVREPGVVELSNNRDQTRKYRWFEPHALLAYCHIGFGKPFFIAPDSLSYDEVIAAAKEARVYNCDPAAVLTIAGADIVRLPDSAGTPVSVDLRGIGLNWQLKTAVRNLRSVTSINLSDATFTDEDVAYLVLLPNLEKLDLSGTAVGDRGIIQLGVLEQLRVVDIRGTHVTPKGMRRLQSRLPDLVFLQSAVSR